ncbi:MAG: MBL fold metallo-hydrolase [Mycobacteriales bacterium]
MRLRVVGSTGSVPGPDNPASCYLIEQDGVRLVVDMGSGGFGALQRYCDPNDIDAVLITHLHADHYLDLCPYAVYRRHGGDGRMPRLPVLGPAETEARLGAAYGDPDPKRLRQIFDFGDLAAGSWDIGPLRVTARRVKHPVTAYALRIATETAALTYSGDTGPCDALVDLASGSDLLLAEATFATGGDLPTDVHMTGREAGEHARRAKAGRLVLTHIPPWGDRRKTLGEAVAVYPGLVELAAAGAAYDM